MKKCDPKAFARCPEHERCGSIDDAVFCDGSECDKFNEEVLRLQGCDCCQGDVALFWEDNENNAFIDRHGEFLVTVKDRSMRFVVSHCPNCGAKFPLEGDHS